MSDSNEENPKPQELRKLNVIKKLKFYKDKAKIALLIREYNKKHFLSLLLPALKTKI